LKQVCIFHSISIKPLICFLLFVLVSCDDERVYKLGVRCCAIWVIALSSWLSDRLFCSLWENIGFPYLHCIWHIFIFLTTYQACVLLAYFSARTEVPEQMPVIEYWPNNTWNFWGIPFVKLKCLGFKPTYKVY
jgi:alkaline ceramidase